MNWLKINGNPGNQGFRVLTFFQTRNFQIFFCFTDVIQFNCYFVCLFCKIKFLTNFIDPFFSWFFFGSIYGKDFSNFNKFFFTKLIFVLSQRYKFFFIFWLKNKSLLCFQSNKCFRINMMIGFSFFLVCFS